jgi:hypothetical protein
MVLKSHATFKFDPPNPKAKECPPDEDDFDTEDEELNVPEFVSGLDDMVVADPPPNVTGDELSNVSKVKTGKSRRGPGPGRKATKAREAAAQLAAQHCNSVIMKRRWCSLDVLLLLLKSLLIRAGRRLALPTCLSGTMLRQQYLKWLTLARKPKASRQARRGSM